MRKSSFPTRRRADARADRAHDALMRVLRAGSYGAIVMLVVTACDQPVGTPAASKLAATSLTRNMSPNDGGSAEVNRELAALRRLTAPFHDLATAEAAGWNVQLTGCMDNPPEGGMGYHYANPSYIDGKADVLQPELLMYEPEKNGQMRLVGVEYIVPFSEVPATATPPRLFGRAFHQNAAFQIWGLHAWVWKENPAGMFEDWNPTVSCRYAP